MSDKRETINAFLNEGVTGICLDARQPGVVVPDLYRQEALVLNISYKYDPPDLVVDDFGISVTLSFSGKRSWVRVPWAALYAARSATKFEAWDLPEAPPAVTKRRGTLGLVKAN